jgi:hypothetical protein
VFLRGTWKGCACYIVEMRYIGNLARDGFGVRLLSEVWCLEKRGVLCFGYGYSCESGQLRGLEGLERQRKEMWNEGGIKVSGLGAW